MKEKKSAGAKVCNLVGSIANTLTVIFLALRACDVITLAWYLVLSPKIAALVLAVLMLAFAGAVKSKTE